MSTHEEIRKLIEASYKKNKDIDTINGYKLDKQLSTSEAKVFHNDSTGKTVIANRGTIGTVRDWTNNAKYATGQYNTTKRMKNARNTQKKAIDKYGVVNQNVGHSQGAIASRKFANSGKTDSATILNPATLGEHTGDNVKTIRANNDVVSILSNKNNNTETIKSHSWNPLINHSPSILTGGTNYISGGSVGLNFVED